MTNTKVVRVGMMPGRIQEFAVEEGTSIKDVLAMAELSTDGYECKVDGVKVDPETTTVTSTTSLVLLVKMVKGNSIKTVRVGMMPGRISEYAVETGTPVSEVLKMAELDASGYDVKVDGDKVEPTSATITESTSLVLLVKQVKGNA